jgi:alpha-N-acetylglucosaminidase
VCVDACEHRYGTDHVYNCDMFNEMTPLSDDAEYLKQSSVSVMNAMTEADPDAVWMMQGCCACAVSCDAVSCPGWLFYAHQRFWTTDAIRAYLSGVPNERMIIVRARSSVGVRHRLR